MGSADEDIDVRYWLSGSVIWGQGSVGVESYQYNILSSFNYSFNFKYGDGFQHHSISFRNTHHPIFRGPYFYGFNLNYDAISINAEKRLFFGIVRNNSGWLRHNQEMGVGYTFNSLYAARDGSGRDLVDIYHTNTFLFSHEFTEKHLYSPFIRVSYSLDAERLDLFRGDLRIGYRLFLGGTEASIYVTPYIYGYRSRSWDDQMRWGVSVRYNF